MNQLQRDLFDEGDAPGGVGDSSKTEVGAVASRGWKTLIDRAIAAGCSRITTHAHAAGQKYWLEHPTRGPVLELSTNNGSLPYARCALAIAAAESAIGG